MNIIKYGDSDKITRKFTCPWCSSVFEAERTEYAGAVLSDEIYVYAAVCPVCKVIPALRIEVVEPVNENNHDFSV